MKLRFSAYWKCQLLGWLIFIIVTYVLNNIIDRDFIGFAYKGLLIFVCGIGLSHLLKLSIDRFGVFEKSFVSQILFLVGLTLLFSATGTYIWLLALIRIGVWNIDEVRKSQPNVFFYQLYFFNFMMVLMTLSGWVLIYFLVHYVQGVRKEEREKAYYKYQVLELEAQALRAQMNPHFIYNCINSIKALIQNDDKRRAIEYLTTFSKLIRTIFQSSDKRQISLYDEIETCKLYTRLEAMRLNGKVQHEFCIDQNLDLKSVMVPTLIIQPFIENAIWHGIVPNDGGKINVSVKGDEHSIICEIDDNGIGRERSKLNKPMIPVFHESKGVHLSQRRLDLEKTLSDTDSTVNIVDKYENNNAAGTRVTVTFNLN